MPRTAINKELFGLGLLCEPSKDFVFFDGQVVAVIHDVVVEVLLVVERPACKCQCDNQGCNQNVPVVWGFVFARSHDVLDEVRDRECCHKRHRGEHHKTVALVDFDAEIAGNVFEDDVRLDVVQQQKGENFEIVEVFLSSIGNGSIDEINGADCEQVVEVAEERVEEFSVFPELHGHHFPVLGEVFKKVTVSLEFAALEAKSLEVADGEECWRGEQRERYEKDGSFCVFFIENSRECKEDESENAENCFLAGLGKKCEDER